MKGIRGHIVLVGFMGSGKSTIGRMLAEILKLEFVDLDAAIVEASGKSIKQLFSLHGEEYFRELESEVLHKALVGMDSKVIATGGGAPCFYDNMKVISENSTSIYLKVGKHKLVDRLRNDKERPLLQNKNDKQLLNFVATTISKRESFYLESDITVRAISNPVQICQRIIERIKKIKR